MSQSPQISHLIVWIDHAVARLYAAKRDRVENIRTLHAPNIGLGNIHHKAGTPGSGHSRAAPVFLKAVTTALEPGREILIVGPSDAKFALKDYIKNHAPLIDARIVAVEPIEKTGDAELHVFAKLFFQRVDRMNKLVR